MSTYIYSYMHVSTNIHLFAEMPRCVEFSHGPPTMRSIVAPPTEFAEWLCLEVRFGFFVHYAHANEEVKTDVFEIEMFDTIKYVFSDTS